MAFSIVFAILFEVVFWIILGRVIFVNVKRIRKNRDNVKSNEKKFDDTIASINVLKDYISVNQSKKSAQNPIVGRKDDCECEESHNINKSDYSYCDYCGARIKKGTKKCPECKAKLHK